MTTHYLQWPMIDTICNMLTNSTTYAISAYHHWCCEFESRSGQDVQHYVIKLVSDLLQVCGFYPGPPLSSTNKTDRHDITEILLKVALSTIKPNHLWFFFNSKGHKYHNTHGEFYDNNARCCFYTNLHYQVITPYWYERKF